MYQTMIAASPMLNIPPNHSSSFSANRQSKLYDHAETVPVAPSLRSIASGRLNRIVHIESPDSKHLLIALHGLYGSHNDFNMISDMLQSSNIDVFVSSSNAGTATTDGLSILVLRLMKEVLNKLQDYESLIQTVHHKKPQIYLSIIGHSLGGLIGRTFIGWLFENSNSNVAFDFVLGGISTMLDKMEARKLNLIRQIMLSKLDIYPVGFYTVSTPHLGTRPVLSPYAAAADLVKLLGVGSTFQELTLGDSPRYALKVISDKNGPFIRALALFRWRTFIGNFKDAIVSVSSSLILPYHVFKEVSNSEFQVIYHDGVDPNDYDRLGISETEMYLGKDLSDSSSPSSSNEKVGNVATTSSGLNTFKKFALFGMSSVFTNKKTPLAATEYSRQYCERELLSPFSSSNNFPIPSSFDVSGNRENEETVSISGDLTKGTEIWFDQPSFESLNSLSIRRILFDYGISHKITETLIHACMIGKQMVKGTEPIIKAKELHGATVKSALWLVNVIISDYNVYSIEKDETY